ncbi:MAG TPA: hypothetical protein VGK81_06820 [Anaerolineae bacterium]
MSVLSCYVPDFLFALLQRQEGDAGASHPMALVGDDGCVLAASQLAQARGVLNGMPTRQAFMRCPDLILHELNLPACQAEHAALLGTLARTGLPVESHDWGSAYVDLREVAHEHDLPDVQSLCADLGQQVRRTMGEGMQPALGWDTGKFTARAASLRSRPGTMRLVSQPDEARFLDPLPITLLPLPAEALQQLNWLGIRTLGHYARLPLPAVQQRFGAAGKLAQQWARGRDDRPVCATLNAHPEPLDIDLDAPTSSQEVVLGLMMHALRPHLQAMAERLEGCRRLQAELRFVDGGTRRFEHVFVQPVCAQAGVSATLAWELGRVTWPAELVGAQLMLLDVGELAPAQLTLFPELEQPLDKPEPFAELTARLVPRYGRIFWSGLVCDERHPLDERRFSFVQQGARHGASMVG